jgi:apolipoprotein N-acyltransferase
MAILAAALAALVCLLVWWPASPDLLNKQISAGYAATVAQNAGELAHIVPALPLPWERAALGFSGSPNL